jgi:Outer membrane protein beta-barrel domain
MRWTALTTGVLVAGATALSAQAPQPALELRPFVGAYIPTGAQRDLFRDAPMFGVQAAVEIKEYLHVLGSFAWAPDENKYQVTGDNVGIYQYDVGAELGFVQALGANWQLKPFIGVGGGARTYDFEARSLPTKTCAAGYGAIGTEFQVGRTALRLEARDYVFCYRSPIAGVDSKTRNDVRLAAGVAYHFR